MRSRRRTASSGRDGVLRRPHIAHQPLPSGTKISHQFPVRMPDAIERACGIPFGNRAGAGARSKEISVDGAGSIDAVIRSREATYSHGQRGFHRIQSAYATPPAYVEASYDFGAGQTGLDLY